MLLGHHCGAVRCASWPNLLLSFELFTIVSGCHSGLGVAVKICCTAASRSTRRDSVVSAAGSVCAGGHGCACAGDGQVSLELHRAASE